MADQRALPQQIGDAEGIAAPLFELIGAASDQDVERMLRALIERYFLDQGNGK